MAKKGHKKPKTESWKESKFVAFLKSEAFRKITGTALIAMSLFMIVAFVSYLFTWKSDITPEIGADGESIYSNLCSSFGFSISHFFIYHTFGIGAFGFILLAFIGGFKLLNFEILPWKKTLLTTIFWMVWISLFFGFFCCLALNAGSDEGLTSESSFIEIFAGLFGFKIAEFFHSKIGLWGLIIFLLLSLFIVLRFVHHVHFNVSKRMETLKASWADRKAVREKERLQKEHEKERFNGGNDDKPNDSTEEKTDMEPEETTPAESPEPAEPVQEKTEPTEPADISTDTFDETFEIKKPQTSVETPEEIPDEEPEPEMKHYGIGETYDPRLDLSDFRFPTSDMLEFYEAKNEEVTNAEMVANKNRIVETLKNYSIDIVKIVASPGPTVTLYEIVPAPGIRISKIKNLEDDIALSLSALGIRIIAPIPGKGTIGIEVPNAKPQVVSMLTMINSDKFQNNKFELPIAIGKTISNEPYVADLAKMPHLLMAGATGQGKSVGLNAIITSLLFKKHPAELKFIMVDPKKVELSLYNKIERHYLAKLPDSEEAIITDVKKVVRTLNSLCIEMDTRYDLLKSAGCRNVKEYNAKFIARQLNPEHGHHFMPYIVVVVDEFADLIMTAGKEVEHPITRIAQLARAVGIHLIIATQRPTVNIITGTIKANFPARIAFRVTSKIDSRTILDTGGADQLIGRGDMLLSSGSEITRLQCALVDTPEIQKIVDYIGEQRGYPDCFLLPEYLDETDEPNKDFDPSKKDEFFEQAARLIVASQHGSTSLLQRKLSLGYNRAGKIIDQLEAAGIVGPSEGSKAREVLVKTDVELEEILRNL